MNPNDPYAKRTFIQQLNKWPKAVWILLFGNALFSLIVLFFDIIFDPQSALLWMIWSMMLIIVFPIGHYISMKKHNKEMDARIKRNKERSEEV